MVTINPTCLQYKLTDQERQTFNETGILHLKNILSPEQVEQGIALTEQIHQTKLAAGHDPKKALFYPNFIPDDPYFINLVDFA
ncbi:MAG: hypothetical protein AAF629_31870, partial [Chloroflexota bacterium]